MIRRYKINGRYDDGECKDGEYCMYSDVKTLVERLRNCENCVLGKDGVEGYECVKDLEMSCRWGGDYAHWRMK